MTKFVPKKKKVRKYWTVFTERLTIILVWRQLIMRIVVTINVNSLHLEPFVLILSYFWRKIFFEYSHSFLSRIIIFKGIDRSRTITLRITTLSIKLNIMPLTVMTLSKMTFSVIT
jgi:hypothetical protein